MTFDQVRPAHSLLEFFRKRLHREIAELGLEPPPREETIWYLCDMLGRFSRSEHLFDYFDGQYGVRPLALIYGEALSAPSDRQRCQLLQRLGELAIFLGAFLQERYRCPPWRAKRRRVVPGSREATRDTRRAEGAKGDSKGASERGVQSYGRPVCSRNELAMLWRNAG